jgi:hypothetical protein
MTGVVARAVKPIDRLVLVTLAKRARTTQRRT